MDTKAYLVIYHSRLFPAHWALFVSDAPTSSAGRLFQVEGDPLNGFAYNFLSNPDARDSIASKSFVELGGLGASDGDIEADVVEEVDTAARLVAPPAPSLKATSSSTGSKVEIQNCQNWVRDLVQKLVDKGMLNDEALARLDTAPKN